MVEWSTVDGRNAGNISLIALSTCGWCRKCKRLLEKEGVAFRYIYVDLIPSEHKNRFKETELKPWNPRLTYPTLIVNEQAIIGFEEDDIRKALSK
ncbi:MAG: glutaredoxin family protein [Deltaproteobacteria bacterium]|nr:glutaredoxin family protein [Deltaproteobacteria bacterium]